MVLDTGSELTWIRCNLASETFSLNNVNLPRTVFGCMDGSSGSTPEDAKTTGLIGMNRGALSFVSQSGYPTFSYCISGQDSNGVLVFGEANSPGLKPRKYTPLVQISIPLPSFDRVAYTVQMSLPPVTLVFPVTVMIMAIVGGGGCWHVTLLDIWTDSTAYVFTGDVVLTPFLSGQRLDPSQLSLGYVDMPPKRRNGNQSSPQLKDPLGDHVSYAEFRTAFTTLAQYAPYMVADGRAKMSKFVSRVNDSMVNKCRSAMLNSDMTLAILMMHAQQIEEQKIRTRERQIPAPSSSSVPAPKSRNIRHDRTPGSEAQGSENKSLTYPLCEECGKNHLGVQSHVRESVHSCIHASDMHGQLISTFNHAFTYHVQRHELQISNRFQSQQLELEDRKVRFHFPNKPVIEWKKSSLVPKGRMALVEIKELKKKLKDHSDRGFIHLSIYQWDATVFFVQKKEWLNSVPSALIDLMNQVFKQCLGLFIIVFIDDILEYSKSDENHANHL
ncbi:putative zinc finger protein [Capsicum annuum]|nr:putative zinc finger protein [Capsicum annuum]KAF3668536.1 putative zinc finger protein [Capsicum annuum]